MELIAFIYFTCQYANSKVEAGEKIYYLGFMMVKADSPKLFRLSMNSFLWIPQCVLVCEYVLLLVKPDMGQRRWDCRAENVWGRGQAYVRPTPAGGSDFYLQGLKKAKHVSTFEHMFTGSMHMHIEYICTLWGNLNKLLVKLQMFMVYPVVLVLPTLHSYVRKCWFSYCRLC